MTRMVALRGTTGKCSLCDRLEVDHGLDGKCHALDGKAIEPVQYFVGTPVNVFVDRDDRMAMMGAVIIAAWDHLSG